MITIPFEVTSSEIYFNRLGIRLDESKIEDRTRIKLIDQILCTEQSIYVLHNTAGVCQSVRDTLIEIRRGLIIRFEDVLGEQYEEFNNYLC